MFRKQTAKVKLLYLLHIFYTKQAFSALEHNQMLWIHYNSMDTNRHGFNWYVLNLNISFKEVQIFFLHNAKPQNQIIFFNTIQKNK